MEREFLLRKNDSKQRLLTIYKEMSTIFTYPNYDKYLDNMEESVKKLKGIVDYQVVLDGIANIRKQVRRPTIFIDSMRALINSKTSKAKKELESLDYNSTNISTTNVPGDVQKYKVAYELNFQMLSLVKSYEQETLKAKEEVTKMKDVIKRLGEFIEKIDNVLIEKIIPEVIRRQKWESMSQDYLEYYRSWERQEDDHRKNFFTMFQFNEIPEIFGHLLLSKNQIPNNEFTKDEIYIQHKSSLESFIQESSKFYKNWHETLKSIQKDTHSSVLRKEKEWIKSELDRTVEKLNVASSTIIEKQNEVDRLRRDLNDLSTKETSTGKVLIDERTKAEDLRAEIKRLSDLLSSKEKSMKILKEERDVLLNDHEKLKASTASIINELKNSLSHNETEIKGYLGVFNDKDNEINSWKTAANTLEKDAAAVKTERDILKTQITEMEIKLKMMTELKDKLKSENTKLKGAS